MQRPRFRHLPSSTSSQYHTNVRGPVDTHPNVFQSAPFRDAHLLQDDSDFMDTEIPYHSNSHHPTVRSFFGALNGYDTDEEDDLMQMTRGYLSSDECGPDSDDADVYNNSGHANFMPRGMEDTPPPPGWRSDAENVDAVSSAFAMVSPLDPLRMPPDAAQSPIDASPASTPLDQATPEAAAPPAIDVDILTASSPWRSPVASGATATPAVDARQAMRDAVRQHAAHSTADLQHANDPDMHLEPFHRSQPRQRPALPTTVYKPPPTALAADGSHPAAFHVLLHDAHPRPAGEDDVAELAALVSPCSHFFETGPARRHPYAAVNPVCEHQTWNMFNSAAAGLLSLGDLRSVVSSMRSTLGLPGASGQHQAGCEAAGGAPGGPAAAASVAYQSCWQEAVGTAQMQYVSDRVSRTGRVPQTRPSDEAHARAAVSVHHDIGVTDLALRRFEQSRSWREVELCAADIAAAASAEEEAAAAAAAQAKLGWPTAQGHGGGGAAVRAGAERGGIWGGEEGYSGVGVPVGRGVPALAVIPDSTSPSARDAGVAVSAPPLPVKDVQRAVIEAGPPRGPQAHPLQVSSRASACDSTAAAEIVGGAGGLAVSGEAQRGPVEGRTERKGDGGGGTPRGGPRPRRIRMRRAAGARPQSLRRAEPCVCPQPGSAGSRAA